MPTMAWFTLRHGAGSGRDKPAEFRRVHEEWLTRALRSRRDYPRIPTRRVDEGGFDAMMSRAEGQEHARLWWDRALDRLDPVEP